MHRQSCWPVTCMRFHLIQAIGQQHCHCIVPQAVNTV